MKNEQNIEVDKNNKVIGLRPRKDFYGGKHIHRSSHLLLFNSTGEVAIMKRSSTKRWYPNLYTFSVSATVANETNEECLIRETQEEIGIDTEFRELFTFFHSDSQDSAFATLYAATSDKQLTPDKEEISEVRWLNLEELKKDTETNPNKYTFTFLKGIEIYWRKYGTNFPSQLKTRSDII